MKIYESILDDLENTENGTSVSKLKDELGQKRDDDFDLIIHVDMEHQNPDEVICANALVRMAESLEEFLDADPNVDDYNTDICSTWPEIDKYILKKRHRVLYSPPKVSGKYEGGLQVKFSYSFRRPIHSLYFFGRMFNSIRISEEWDNIIFKLYKKKEDKRLRID